MISKVLIPGNQTKHVQVKSFINSGKLLQKKKKKAFPFIISNSLKLSDHEASKAINSKGSHF